MGQDHSPQFSFFLGVYNGEDFLAAALDSMLAQTVRDMEIIAVDDGSSDASPLILRDYAKNHKNIKVITQDNQGLAAALNAAIPHLQGQYWVRTDADDINEANRLEIQLRYMEEHPDVDILSAGMTLIDENGDETGIWSPAHSDHEHIHASMIFGNYTLPHAVCMFRAESLKPFDPLYANTYAYSEDYDLWTRIGDKVRFATLPDRLYRRRFHSACVTIADKGTMGVDSLMIRRNLLGKMGLNVSDEEFETHKLLCGVTSENPVSLGLLEDWIERIVAVNRETQYFSHDALLEILQGKLQAVLLSRLWGGARPMKYLVSSDDVFSIRGAANKAKYMLRSCFHV